MKNVLTLVFVLISSNCLAEIRFHVINNVTGKEFGPQVYEGEKPYEQWKQENITNDSWGKKNRWERPQDKDNPTPGYTDQREVVTERETYTEYFYPQEYTITETDVTAEMDAKRNKRAEDALTLQGIRTKLSNKAPLTNTEILNYIRIKEGL